MKILGETLFERIQNRPAPANAVRVIKTLERAAARREIDYMTVKEASELIDRYKLEARIAIRAYRKWTTRNVVTEMLTPLNDHQGRILHKYARASAALYIDAMRDYRDLLRLASLPYRDARFYPANDRDDV